MIKKFFSLFWIQEKRKKDKLYIPLIIVHVMLLIYRIVKDLMIVIHRDDLWGKKWLILVAFDVIGIINLIQFFVGLFITNLVFSFLDGE